MPSSTVTTLQPILKQVYEKLAQETLYDAKPLYALMPKDTKFVGETSRSRCATRRNPEVARPFKRARQPGTVWIQAVRPHSSQGLRDRFAGDRTGARGQGRQHGNRHRRDGIDHSRPAQHRASLALPQPLRRRRRFRAQVASGMASSTITLSNPKDIVWFEVGMKLDGSAANGLSGAATAGGAAAKIVSIDRDAGTLTNDGSANWNAATGINGLSANWYLFRRATSA